MVRETTIAISQQKQHESKQIPYILLDTDYKYYSDPGAIENIVIIIKFAYTLGGEEDTGAYRRQMHYM